MSDAAADMSTQGSGPFSRYERMIAFRYLRSKRKETIVSIIALISLLGITLGVATLVVVMAVMNGFRVELLNRILGTNGHIIVQPIDTPLNNYNGLATRFEGVDGVKFAIPIVEGQGLASGSIGAGTGVLVRGVRDKDLPKIGTVYQNVRQGSFENFESSEGVAIGIRMAENLGLTVGDLITIVSPDGDITPMGVTPRVKAYPVSAVFEIGMTEYDSGIIYMPLKESQLYFNSEGKVQSVELILDDPDRVDEYRATIEEAAKRPVFLTDWRQRNRSFFSALQVERNVMFMILTMIVLVAALNIVAGLIMLVKDKGRDIAILRTMGATSGAIMRIFIMTGTFIGVVGTLSGLLLGLVICWNVESIRQFFTWISGKAVFDPNIYFLSQLPAKVNAGETITVLVMTLILVFLATLIPAWRAARIDPVVALRYE